MAQFCIIIKKVYTNCDEQTKFKVKHKHKLKHMIELV